MRAPMPPHKVIPLDPMLGAASRPESANVRTQRLRPGVQGQSRLGRLSAPALLGHGRRAGSMRSSDSSRRSGHRSRAGEARLPDESESGARAHATVLFLGPWRERHERPVREAHDFDDSQLRPVTVPTRDNAPTGDLTCGVAEPVGGHA
jgi:hypothetical protein